MTRDMVKVAEAIRAFERGEIVVVTDDDDRENEGDLFVAASLCTPEKMAFIIRHTSGIVCAAMTREEAARLNLAPMVAANDAPLGTAFTVTVDYRHGLTTGISAEERSNTVRALANNNAGAQDFVRPGHVFPLIARDGGVLIRSGHTEACVDLCKLAGQPPIGALSELVNDDGTVKRGDQVSAFAAEHGLAMVSVADLIAWRQRQEKLVERIDEFAIDTSVGPAKAIIFRTPYDPMHHLAVVFGDIRDGREIPVRLHLESLVDDVFGAAPALPAIMDRMRHYSRGVIIYLREGSVGVTSTSRRSRDTLAAAELEEHASAESRAESWREIGLGAQILKDIGISSIRLLSTRERHYVGLDGFGIDIVATEILDR